MFKTEIELFPLVLIFLAGPILGDMLGHVQG